MTLVELLSWTCLLGGAAGGLVGCTDTGTAWWGWVVCGFAGFCVGVLGALLIGLADRRASAGGGRLGEGTAFAILICVCLASIPGTVAAAMVLANALAGVCR